MIKVIRDKDLADLDNLEVLTDMYVEVLTDMYVKGEISLDDYYDGVEALALIHGVGILK
jgi:hypothetical protein